MNNYFSTELFGFGHIKDFQDVIIDIVIPIAIMVILIGCFFMERSEVYINYK